MGTGGNLKTMSWLGLLAISGTGIAIGWAAGEGAVERGLSRVHDAAALRKSAARTPLQIRAQDTEVGPTRTISSVPGSQALEWMSRPPVEGSEDERQFKEWKQGLKSDPAAGFVYLRNLATGWLAEGREVEARTALQWMKEVRSDTRVFTFLSEQARGAMGRPREGVDSGVLTAVALAETLEHLGATADDRRRLARHDATD